MLITLSAFDLGQDRLPNFAAYRFLYERLIGASSRPWLPAAFCAAAALPNLHPDDRRALLQSIGEAAATARVGAALRERGLLVGAIRPPTVPLGSSRLRITASAAHTPEQIARLLDALRDLLPRRAS